MQDNNSIYMRAKVRLITRYPFFATLLLASPPKERSDIPTAGVDKRGQIYYNPDFFESLDVEEVAFILCHEVMHKIGMHIARCGDRDKKIWNIANDAWINDTLKEANVFVPPSQGVYIPGSKDRVSEDIYDEMMKNQQKYKQMASQGGDGMTGDDLLDEGDPVSESEQRMLETQIKCEVAAAAETAKIMGNMPSNMQRIVDQLLHVKTPWQTILERYMTMRIQYDVSWKRPNRRFETYLPSISDGLRLRAVGILVDTSGSIGQKELEFFWSHARTIIEACSPNRVHIAYCDTHVDHHDTFEFGELPDGLTVHGGGGTDMREGVRYLVEADQDLDVIIVLTDGYTPFPEIEEVPTVWAITTKEVAPSCAGSTIHIEED